MRPIIFALGLSLFSASAIADTPTDNPRQSELDLSVDKVVTEYFKNSCHPGLSIALSDKGNVTYYNYGTTSRDKPQLPMKNSIYMIGSITKTFVGTLAAKAVLDGKMTLDGDFRSYLKAPYPNLEVNGKPITLRDLADYKSGLPTDIPNLDAFNAAYSKDHDYNKFMNQVLALIKDWDEERYLKELHSVQLASEPGTRRQYSTLGNRVISYGLENVYGKPFRELLKHDITAPHGMTHTAVSVSKAEMPLLVRGHGPEGKPTAVLLNNEDPEGMFSTPEDLMKYAAWQLDEADPIISKSHAIIDSDGPLQYGLIWLETAMQGERVIGHTGGSPGMSSLLSLFPDSKASIALLANDVCADAKGDQATSTQAALVPMSMAIRAAQRHN